MRFSALVYHTRGTRRGLDEETHETPLWRVGMAKASEQNEQVLLGR